MTVSAKYWRAWQGNQRHQVVDDEEIFVYPGDALYVRLMWERRRAFITTAVNEGIITATQGQRLILLHAERDKYRPLATYE